MVEFVSGLPWVPDPDVWWHRFVGEALDRAGVSVSGQFVLGELANRYWVDGWDVLSGFVNEHGGNPNAVWEVDERFRCSDSRWDGFVVLLSDRDLARVGKISGVDVVSYESVSPHEVVDRYPGRIWISRFWFGGVVWAHRLGVPAFVVDIPLLLNWAWLAPSTRALPVQMPGSVSEQYDGLVSVFPHIVSELVRLVRT